MSDGNDSSAQAPEDQEKQNIVKVRRAQDGHFMPIPEVLAKALDIKKGDRLVLSLDERNYIIVKPGSVLSGGMCEICGEKEHHNTCKFCGRKVCSSCFWRMGGICKKCGYVGRDGQHEAAMEKEREREAQSTKKTSGARPARTLARRKR